MSEILFADVDPASVEASVLTAYEQIANTTLYPGDPVRLFLESVAYIAVRLRGNKKVQNLSSMWYKKLPQQLATQGDFGLEPSYYTLLSTAIPDTGTCF